MLVGEWIHIVFAAAGRLWPDVVVYPLLGDRVDAELRHAEEWLLAAERKVEELFAARSGPDMASLESR